MTDEQEGQTPGLDDDFNLDEDYKAAPLIPKGNYKGDVTGIKLDQPNFVIVFSVLLNGNVDMMCSDGETPVDGRSLPYNIWMPKPGDRDKMTAKSGETTYQWKINNMLEVFQSLKIPARTMTEIRTGIEKQEWTLESVKVDVDVDTYRGKTKNVIQNINLP